MAGARRPIASRRGARAAPWSPTASREEVRAYVQQRVTLFSKLMFWIFWVLVGFVLSMYEIYPRTRPARASIVHGTAVIGLVVLGLIWYFALHRRRLSLEVLYAIDTFYTVLIGTVFGMSAYFSLDQPPAVYSAFIWNSFMVFSRVIVIPSSARRTAVVTGIAFVPLVIAATAAGINFPALCQLPPPALVVGALIFATIGVLLATTGSRVIYGLNKRLDAAKQLGGYTLIEKIGEGGMGTVWRAHHALLRRATAIKLLRPSKNTADSMRSFEHEAQQMSRLTHPNTVAIFDYGQSADGAVFYYAMELLDGIDLEQLVAREGAQSPARILHILRQVCGALDEAHGIGLTHRDIKPANIILCERGRIPDVAKIVDFGLVKDVARDLDDGDATTIAGTPTYLAPEQVTDPGLVGPRSDLYALGAVGYFLLTGKRVFEGASAHTLFVQHATEAPVPPSQRTDREVPAELEAIILQCLAKDPSARPDSALALDRALTAIAARYPWDEAAASAWWATFVVRHAAERAKQKITVKNTDSEPTLDAPAETITVDLAARRDYATTTGQVT